MRRLVLIVIVYMAALVVWISMTCAIWCAAGLMCVVPQTRPFAWPMSLAAAAAFPFVFAYQIMAAPVVLTMQLLAFALWKLLEPASTIRNPLVIGGFISALYGSVVIMLVASIAGYADGWRTGWGLARGRSRDEMLSRTIPARWFGGVLARISGRRAR